MQVIKTNQITMSSVEICEVLRTNGIADKRHDHILRDIDNMMEEVSPNLGTPPTSYEGTYVNQQNGQEYRCWHLGKDHALCLVAGYSAKIRMAIINRMNELEAELSAPKEITVHSSRAILFAELARQAEELERAEAQAEQLKLTVEQQSELIDEAAQEIAAQEEELRQIEIELQWLVRFEQFKEAISSTDLATIFKEKLFKIDGVRSHEFKPSVQEINIILMKMGLIGHRVFRGEKKPNPTVIYQAFYERFPQVPVKQQHNGVPEAMKFNRTSDYFTKFLVAVKKYGVKHKIGVKQVPGNGAFTF